MSLIEAVVLGIVQGLTEFLPISSSAHLRVVPALVGWEDPGAAFTAVTQLGTIGAVLLYFRTDLMRISRAALRGVRNPVARREPDARLAWYILVGTVPIGVAGVMFEETIQSAARNLMVVGLALILLALLLLLAERLGSHERGTDSLRLKDGVLIGLAQAVALIPGVSRSGGTITAGLLLNLDRRAAARYSFLLSVPAVIASGLFQLPDLVNGATDPLAAAVATVLAFVVGYASIAWLLRFLTAHSTAVFAAYRIVLGVVVLGLAARGVIA